MKKELILLLVLVLFISSCQDLSPKTSGGTEQPSEQESQYTYTKYVSLVESILQLEMVV